ncbi:MAG: hypothetical protein FWD09_02460 [Lentimicrobiaceae bacterium]|nr:hypothetical protein [Lentimicrobiaceae bacterium]
MDTLEKNKDKPLFEVPEHYFEQLQHNVMQHVAKEERRQKWQKKWISAAAVAASLAVIVTLSVYLITNSNPNDHFYVHEEIAQPEDSILTLDTNHLAENTEIIVNEFIETNETPVAKETIVYRAVDFYVDDYEIDSFCEVMYDLECYFDY